MSACRGCKKKEREGVRERQLLGVRRIGAGSYNRAPRRYHSSICVECATDIVEYDDQMIREERGRGAYSDGFEVSDVRHTLEQFNERNPK